MSSLSPGPDSDFYEPHSSDAMFARILTELGQIKGQLAELKGEHSETRSKIAGFETDRAYQRGVVAAVAAGVSGVVGILVAAASHWLKKE